MLDAKLSPKSTRVLGFDFGLKRIGTAIGNIDSGASQALSVIHASKGVPDWNQIEQLIRQWLPSFLIISLPFNIDGSEGRMAKRSRKFGEQVGRYFNLGIVFVDERFSTVAADALLLETATQGKSLSRRRLKFRDSLAAELIVRAYLDYNKV